MIKPQPIDEVRKKVNNLRKQNKKVTVLGRDIRFNRQVLELNPDMLILQHKPKKDRLKQRVSGLNEVLCKIAKKNKTILAIDLNELKNEKSEEEKGKILSRMIQNLRLIKKKKNKFRLLNFQNKSQAKSLLLTLGLPTNQVKEAVNY